MRNNANNSIISIGTYHTIAGDPSKKTRGHGTCMEVGRNDWFDNWRPDTKIPGAKIVQEDLKLPNVIETQMNVQKG